MRWEAKVSGMHKVAKLKWVVLLLVSPLVLSSAGCSTVTGWFSSSKPAAKPAALIDFKPAVRLTRGWEASVGKSGPYLFSPASDDQAVYAAGMEGRIAKLDLATGRELWRIDAGKPLSAGVGVGEGLVLVGTHKGELLAFHSLDGKPAWQAKLSGEILVPPVAGYGAVVARSNDGRVAMFEASSGKLRWDVGRTLPALTLREQSHLQITENAVYAGHAGGRLSALAINNGAPLWETNVALPKGTTELERIADVVGPLAINDKVVCGASFQGRVACFNLAKGNAAWARDVSALRGVGMDERLVYVADEHGAVMAYDKLRGTNPWKQEKLRDRGLSSPVPVADRYVAVGDYQGQVHLLNADDGAFVARAATDGSAIQSVMISLKSGLLVQTSNGGIQALKIE